MVAAVCIPPLPAHHHCSISIPPPQTTKMAAAASDASVLEAELARVQNACSHLEQSNVELRDAIRDAGYDRE